MDVFYNPELYANETDRNLPHWFQNGKCYFVTFRLGDSIPQSKIEELKERRAFLIREYGDSITEQHLLAIQILMSKRVGELLDNLEGECLLRIPECKKILSGAIRFFDLQRYQLDHWVIMPNHVHIIMKLNEDWKLSSVMHSIKSYSANEINKYLKRSGKLWQDESFDHIIRSEPKLHKFRKYIISNAKASRDSMLSCNEII